MDDFIAMLFQQFEIAAGKAALNELKLRMLAERIPELENFAHARRLEDVETPLIKWFRDRTSISDDESELLRRCRALRNKLLHGDFYVVREKLHEQGTPQMQGSVRKIDFEGSSDPKRMLEKITAAASNVPGSYTVVDDTNDTAEIGIAGWLLELGNAGYLEEAARVFQRTDKLLDSLADKSDELMNPRRRR